jgi:4-hydroxy-tetrahydrodipicolinate synthase
MNKSKFTGTGVAMITPFTSSKEVDYDALAKVINHLINGKVDYLVSLGTTGETSTLAKEEKDQIVAFTKKNIAGRVPLVVGIGGNDTSKIINTIQNTDLSGIDAILSVSPAYNKPNQNGIFEHYKAICESSPLPIILYNVPARTGSNITAETTLRIANHSAKFIAIKEASGIMEQCMRIIRDKPEGFLVISGDDLLTLPCLGMGMDGVISVAAHADPFSFSEMVRQALANNFTKARELHYKLLDIMTGIFEDGSPGGIKAILHYKGICENEVRLPLFPINELLYKKLTRGF